MMLNRASNTRNVRDWDTFGTRLLFVTTALTENPQVCWAL
jgi:hypothetical protein